jgi:hypothetical protein
MNLSLHHDPFGRLVYTDAAGVAHVGVEPVRAFPISEPGRGVAILDRRGQELAWIDDLESLAPEQRQFLQEELSRRHFLPVVTKLHAIEGMTDPTTWRVETDRGPTTFQIKNEEDIRRVARSRVLLVDTHGIRYLIPDYHKLDAPSRRLLERYI